ncbi:putative protein-glutamate O-methyltransferase isoform X2 [Orussus abietinus]|uniref:putative protein-glutamate O-methyltransferase isoform X2 n=1 Tax=Orussus abietinus TaxID=222816 RepID=UPI000C715E10|nr:putative protein-glutamate O-methyltransferase isoform X2 [Orussus abietinus]
MSATLGSQDTISGLLDITTPLNSAFKGIYMRSYAFVTLKDRLPGILTKVIDILSRDKEEIGSKYGKESLEELKDVIGCISKLKNEIVTNKPLKPLSPVPDDAQDDSKIWNDYLEETTKREGQLPTWFQVIWLYSEGYMYRRLAQDIALTRTLQCHDYFAKLKQNEFWHAKNNIHFVSVYLVDLFNRNENISTAERKHEFIKLLKLSLWANRCDLCLNVGTPSNQGGNPIELLESFESDILVNDSMFVWDLLNKNKTADIVIVDIVLDNAGYELFVDFCLAIFLIAQNLAQKIRLYVKRIPWYVSDTTINDFHWIIEKMKASSNNELKTLGEIASSHLKSHVWTIEEESFWTQPYDYPQMKIHDPVLYAKLSEATLVIFKGDLNYRKLLADINFAYTTNFVQALQGFSPTNILSLRTIKSNGCVGLQPGKAESLTEMDENWMITGRYGLIQATVDTGCPCAK